MGQLKPTKTVYTVSDFLDWQRNGTLRLKPIFQRREVWAPKAKSYLIDTVVRGLPVPIIFLRKNQDLKNLSSVLEVVDGQQRLRTLFSFISPGILPDFDAGKDAFLVRASHNAEIADKPFDKLDKETQRSILGYEISTHVLPPDTADELVLRIFARLNSTGVKLNQQELRNAEYFGEFKSLVYDLAIRNLHYWRRWQVFDDDDLARMVEAEAVSDYLGAVIGGVQGKSQPRLNRLYSRYDDEFKGAASAAYRFQRVLELIDERVGNQLAKSSVRRHILFYSLFTACYEHVFGFKSDYRKKAKPKELPEAFPREFQRMDKRIQGGRLPAKILDAIEHATADKGRRDTRHRFFMESLHLVPAH